MTLEEFKIKLEYINNSHKREKNYNPLFYAQTNEKILPIISFTIPHNYQPNLILGSSNSKSEPMDLSEMIRICKLFYNRVKLMNIELLPVCVDWTVVTQIFDTYYKGSQIILIS